MKVKFLQSRKTLALILGVVLLLLLLGALLIPGGSAKPEPDKDFLIILGCGIRKDGTPSQIQHMNARVRGKFFRRTGYLL